MINLSKVLLFVIIVFSFQDISVLGASEIPVNHPYIQYFGRWDLSDSVTAKHSWPGVYIAARFEGTSIGVKMNDNLCYYNIYIDGELSSIFHPDQSGVASYTLKAGLPDGVHTILISKRNETNWTKFDFNGFILDDGKNLLPPDEKPTRKIEFIGDSFTCASGNEATTVQAPSDVDYYTNIDEGFAPITAKYFGAQYHVSGRSGYGLVLDYLGNYSGNVPDNFNRTLLNLSEPKWDFEQWVPNLVVICLGLNDYSGFGGWSGSLTQSETELFISRYHQFISQIRDYYKGVKILAVAAHVQWIQDAVKKVVDEENNSGHNDIYYTYFPYYDGGYVNNGHPNVATHHKIADRLISAIDTLNAWESYDDKIPPQFTKVPEPGFIVYDTTYLLKVRTDTYANVRYSFENKVYEQMEYQFTTTGKRDHEVNISCEHGKEYSIYIKAVDVNGNIQENPALVTFTVDTTKILVDWKSGKFIDTGWNKGVAPLGIKNSQTLISNVSTAYFRKKFVIDDLTRIAGVAILIKGSDGAVVYLNGYEIARINMSEIEEINFNSTALQQMIINKMIVVNSNNNFDKLLAGENILAVEVHSNDLTNPNVLFDSQLIDDKNKKYYTLGSEWNYSDAGFIPADQLIDKITTLLSDNHVIPLKNILYENYPNPFNPETNISFIISEKTFTELRVFDIIGRVVETVVSEELEAGKYSYKFNAKNYASGLYFYQLKTNTFTSVKKMVLLK